MIEVIEYYNQVISDWIRAYYADGTFLLLAIMAFIYLYVSCKELRYKFLLPLFVMLFITVNPILHMYIFRRIVYWRMLWMLPTTVLIGTAVVVLLKLINKICLKWALLLIFVAFVVSQGKYMFANGVFSPRNNWEKVSQETIDVCDIMLNLDDEIKAVVPTEELLSEMRQYAPDISLIYGRNAVGFIRYMEWYYKDLYTSINNAEYEYVLLTAINNEVNVVVVPSDKEIEIGFLNKYKYEEVGRTARYIVYYNEEIEDVL